MKVWQENYKNKVCPHCKSKHITRAYVQKVESWKSEYYVEPQINSNNQVQANHFICSNCKRVTHENDIIWRYDRKEMKRDAERLLKFLAGDKNENA